MAKWGISGYNPRPQNRSPGTKAPAGIVRWSVDGSGQLLRALEVSEVSFSTSPRRAVVSRCVAWRSESPSGAEIRLEATLFRPSVRSPRRAALKNSQERRDVRDKMGLRIVEKSKSGETGDGIRGTGKGLRAHLLRAHAEQRSGCPGLVDG